MFSIVPFISYSDGVLRCDGKPISVRQLAIILEENYSTYNKAINSLIKHNIIAKSKIQLNPNNKKLTSCLVANPNIFMKGKDMSKWSIELFNTNTGDIEIDRNEC